MDRIKKKNTESSQSDCKCTTVKLNIDKWSKSVSQVIITFISKLEYLFGVFT